MRLIRVVPSLCALRAAFVACGLAAVTPVSGQGSPWKHPDGTTHWYQAVVVPAGIDWVEANAAAHAAGGYLATITSAQEGSFVFSLIDNFVTWPMDDGPWIGGVQWPASTEPASGWGWANHEPFVFQNWASSKPDNSGNADRMHFGGDKERSDRWSDAPATKRLSGYVIERSGPTVPRTMGLVQHDAGAHDGFVLLAPLFSGQTWLVDARGRVVNSWQSSFPIAGASYLLPNSNLLRTVVAGNAKFTVGGNGGGVVEYDWTGNVVWAYVYSSPTVCHHHDAIRLPNGNTLLIAWELKTSAEAIAAGRDPALLLNGELYPDHIVEVKPAGVGTGTIVWEWHVWDHLVQDRDPTKANYGAVALHPELVDVNYPPLGRLGGGIHDWMHSNAIAYNARLDQIVLSVRHFNELWVIDHSTTTAQAAGHTGGRSGRGGDILYRWGNPEAYRAGTEADRQLFQQHNVHWIDDKMPGGGNFLMFNNGLERASSYSAVYEVKPPTPDAQGNYPRTGAVWGPTQPTWSYVAANPTSFYSPIISGAARLPSGNTLVCGGVQGNTFEVTPAGKTLWRYINPVTSFPWKQGDDITGNSQFRSPWYAADDPAFTNRTLTRGNPIEAVSTVLLVEGASASLPTRIGTQATLTLHSPADAGAYYVVGTSATPGMFPVDFRYVRVGLDPMFLTSMTGGAPAAFQGYFGFLDAQGRATARLVIPALPALSGIDLYSTFAVVDVLAPNGVGTIGNTVLVSMRQ